MDPLVHLLLQADTAHTISLLRILCRLLVAATWHLPLGQHQCRRFLLEVIAFLRLVITRDLLPRLLPGPRVSSIIRGRPCLLTRICSPRTCLPPMVRPSTDRLSRLGCNTCTIRDAFHLVCLFLLWVVSEVRMLIVRRPQCGASRIRTTYLVAVVRTKLRSLLDTQSSCHLLPLRRILDDQTGARTTGMQERLVSCRHPDIPTGRNLIGSKVLARLIVRISREMCLTMNVVIAIRKSIVETPIVILRIK